MKYYFSEGSLESSTDTVWSHNTTSIGLPLNYNVDQICSNDTYFYQACGIISEMGKIDLMSSFSTGKQAGKPKY